MQGVNMKNVILWTTVLAVLLSGMLTTSAWGATNTRADISDSKRLGQINGFNIGQNPTENRSVTAGIVLEPIMPYSSAVRIPVGSTSSTNVGLGPGVSIDRTWDDAQWTWGLGRQIEHWWNGSTGEDAAVSVHFGYSDRPDTLNGYPYTNTGYNVYDAVSGDWPRTQDLGCDLQAADTLGTGTSPSMAMTFNGRVVISSTARHFRTIDTTKTDSTGRLWDNFIYYQGVEFNCTYDPRSNLNVTWVDTTTYRPLFMQHDTSVYSRDPQVVTQFDGMNTIVHLLLGENSTGSNLTATDYVPGLGYYTWTYFRKVGNTAGAGSWSAGQIIDSIWFPWTEMSAAPYPYQGVAVVYTNPSYYGSLLDNPNDLDVWCRESFNRGATWQTAYSVTNYDNAFPGGSNHFAAWLEAGCMFDSEGDLHVYWTAKPTSANPYFDGFEWLDFDQNLYHWEKTNGDIVPGVGDAIEVANGTFMNDDNMSGSMSTAVCGFGGDNSGYIGWITMGECDNKLYLVWSQIHERANRFPWRTAGTQPAPGVLDDCSYTGQRLAMANWELMMSVAQLATSTLWDAARNITNTYTPKCGLDGDPLAERQCGSEWKPSLERYALDETGLTGLTWPTAAEVDLSPYGNYSGHWYLNMEYMDDQFPGPAFWGTRTNPPGTENSEKWIRLACVEPIETPQIEVIPKYLAWPQWIELGTVKNFEITVVNDGNVSLAIGDISSDYPHPQWLDVSEHPTELYPIRVPAGVNHTFKFDIIIDASAIATTQWLDGKVYLRSDAAGREDSLTIPIRILAAPDVEAVVWDTVTTHQNMFDPFLEPLGVCVALAVGNNGELGWGAGTRGGINLDYAESGLECGTRARDSIYLSSSTAFTILATSSGGADARLTQVTNDANQADVTGWDPVPSKTMTGGLTASGKYDSVYTGKFVNRDTTIAMERIVFAPRSLTPSVPDTINYMVVLTKVYSADGLAHNHLTLGNVCDWDVPSESVPFNVTGVSDDGFVYVQGTDTTASGACQLNATRFATEAFGGYFTVAGDCIDDGTGYYSQNAMLQTLMVDTSNYRDGTPLSPAQPNPLVWWTETGVAGLNADPTRQDQAVWLTVKHDYNLSATDVLYYWTVLTTTRVAANPSDGLTALEAQVTEAKHWFLTTIGSPCPTCCVGRIGDVNNSGGDGIPTISDVSMLIDALFITGNCSKIVCIAEADANQSGGSAPSCSDLTIGDISSLIDYLFITGPSKILPYCIDRT
jgi:hypothetical protein